ncbi:MAG: hypothetical protein PHV66_08435 [Bacteroidales bacterium]|nr:hypothetical protein [Bacteroidales bacterium]
MNTILYAQRLSYTERNSLESRNINQPTLTIKISSNDDLFISNPEIIILNFETVIPSFEIIVSCFEMRNVTGKD